MLLPQPGRQIKSVLILWLAVAVIYFLALPAMLCFKNDGIFSHYPIKYFIGESFANGQVPVWNAFINWGYPQYADLTGAWWNPLTWIIGTTTHYPVWAFHLEQILYLFIAATGMRRLLLFLQIPEYIALVGAISYISCGYLGEHYLFKEWVCGAAFLPWCFLFQIKSLTYPSIINNTGWAACLFLFVASAHPSQSIALLYASLLILALAAWQFQADKKWNKATIKRQSLYLLITAVTFLVLALGMAMSYLEVIPFLRRGEALSGKLMVLPTGTTLQSWVTLFTPLAGIKNNEWFGNWQLDNYMARNCFISTICLAALLPVKGYKFQSIEKKIWILFGLFFCLSSVAPFRMFCFKYMPLFGFTQMNGVYRIFPMLFLIVLACYRLRFIFSHKENSNSLLKNLKLLALIYLLIALAALSAIFRYGYPGIKMLLSQGVSPTVLKNVLYAFSNSELWLIQGLAGLFFTAALLFAIKKSSLKWVMIVLIAEGAFYINVFLPFSSLQSRTQHQVQQIINHHKRSNASIPFENMPDSSFHLLKTEFRHPNIFLHQTYQDSIEESPMMFSTAKTLVPNHKRWLAQPYSVVFYPTKEVSVQNDTLFSADYLQDSCCNNQNSGYIRNWDAKPGNISFTLSAPDNGYCLVMQSFYPGWIVTVNGKEYNPVVMNSHFLAVAVSKGTNQVRFAFDAGWKPWWIGVDFILLSLIAGASGFGKMRRYLRMRKIIKEPGNQLFRNSQV